MTEITAKSIVERILFGKGGSKADYAKDIEALIEAKCKEQRDICAKEWIMTTGDDIEEIIKAIGNAPSPNL